MKNKTTNNEGLEIVAGLISVVALVALACIGIYALGGGFSETEEVYIDRVIYKDRIVEVPKPITHQDWDKLKVGDFVVYRSFKNELSYNQVVDKFITANKDVLVGLAYYWSTDQPIATTTKKAQFWRTLKDFKELPGHYSILTK